MHQHDSNGTVLLVPVPVSGYVGDGGHVNDTVKVTLVTRMLEIRVLDGYSAIGN
jgi:hypothetical protein